MWVEKKDSHFLSYVILLVSLFILILFTRGQYTKLQSNLDTRDTHLATLQEKRDELVRLNDIKAIVTQEQWNYEKYMIEIDESEIIESLYSYVESLNSQEGIINMKNINFSQPKKNEFGFTQTDILIQAVVSNETTLIRFLDFLVDEKSDYPFFLDSFSYSNDGRKWPLSVTIPLKIFYK